MGEDGYTKAGLGIAEGYETVAFFSPRVDLIPFVPTGCKGDLVTTYFLTFDSVAMGGNGGATSMLGSISVKRLKANYDLFFFLGEFF